MSFVTTAEYVTLPRQPNSWVIEHILPTSGLLNIYGKPKVAHKSFFALQLAQAIANPEIHEILSFPIHTHGPVAYLQVDTPRGLWVDRLTQWFPGIDGVHFADTLIAPYPFDILGSGYEWLKKAIEQLQPVALIVDTLREIHVGDENDSAHMQLVVNSLVAATRPTACILLSHSRKNMPEGQFDIMAENRGSGYVAGRMDAIVYLSKDRLIYQSRTAELTDLHVTKSPLLALADPVEVHATLLVRDNPALSIPELVALIRREFPKATYDRVRGLVLRRKGLAADAAD